MSAAEDIAAVERRGYTRGEALEYVTWRAVFEARRIAERADLAKDRELLLGHLAYLDELRSICVAEMDQAEAV